MCDNDCRNDVGHVFSVDGASLLFLAELCEMLDVPRPEPTVEDGHQNAYVFERNVGKARELENGRYLPV